jgi:glycosyltransferase involved in cell wall biosynthesis
MENLKISIVTASYNYAGFIKEAIQSVMAQTYTNWELIVVDDGSKDNSVEVINDFCNQDSRIKLFQHENGVNKGLKETVLFGISQVSGDYVAFLESDDIWAENYLAEKVKIAQKYSKAKVIFNDVELFGDAAVIEDYDKYFELNRKFLNKKFPANLFNGFSFQNLVPTFSCVMVEADTLKKADFNSSVQAFMDHWAWAHLAYDNDFYYIDKKLTKWRMHSNSYIEQSQQGNEKMFMASILKSFQEKGFKKRMFFWNRHKNPKIEKIFRGFFRNFT